MTRQEHAELLSALQMRISASEDAVKTAKTMLNKLERAHDALVYLFNKTKDLRHEEN